MKPVSCIVLVISITKTEKTATNIKIVVTGKIASPATLYATAGGVIASFISVFWSFGYIQLSEELERTANEPSKLENGIVLNLLGRGAAILGMQSTVGLLVAKALTPSTTTYYQRIAPGSGPVLALDVLLVQIPGDKILGLAKFFLGIGVTGDAKDFLQ
ncbi:Protein TIC 21 [Hibiscus syriacus]|uniref:Protein TIC 21 n=1 Tax=Hibiscus syriacus TaxID=106335 RepID=A0A6A3ABL1_HIBSY|nr:Protein TIC 21 [Hibiscus syriacus]